jgi:Tfp pilus assembly protein PilF
MVWSAYYNRAMLYLRADDTARGVLDLERAARSNPAHLTSEVWIDLARNLERLGRSDLALELLLLGRDEAAFDAGCWRTLGNLQVLTGKAEEAVGALEKAAGLAPGDYRTYALLGFAGQQSGDEALAVRAYRKALELGAANRPEILNNLGQALAGLDSLASAESVYLEALRENADYLDARVNLGLLYRRKGEPLDARVQLELALRLCRDRPALSDAARRIESLLADLKTK